MSQDYQTHQLNIEESNLIGPIRTRHNTHTHTDNTCQSESQLKSSSCSSAILSHNSRDAILSHNSRNATCLTSIPSHNSRDTFGATTQGTPASRPLKYHQSLVDHAYPKHVKHFCLNNLTWRCSRVARHKALPNRLAGDTYHQAPSATAHLAFLGIA